MQALNIQSAEITPEQRAKMEELDKQEVESAPATKEGGLTASGTPSGRLYCSNCGAAVTDPSAHFCEHYGYEFH